MSIGSHRSVRLARAAWLVVAIAGTILFAAGPASQWPALQTVCHPDSACLSYQLNAVAAGTLREHGIAMGAYAVSMTAVLAAVWALWYGLAALIIWRKPGDRGALLSAYFLVVFPVWSLTVWLPAGPLPAGLTGVFLSALLLFGLLFPDGHFSPPWTRWLAGAIVLFFALSALPLPDAASISAALLLVACFVAVLGAQIHRYRVVSSPVERQQTKWAVVGFTVTFFLLPFTWLLNGIAPFPTETGSLYSAVSTVAGIGIVVSAIPISIATAVLRNRLWDIDRVINRALVYATLTLTLATVYIGGVIGLQTLFRLVVGSRSGLAVALSTLAIAALAGPLRRGIQTGIDRRFYRRKYDATRTLADFGDRLRDEVDLTRISQELMSVVHETLNPEHVSLWLRQ